MSAAAGGGRLETMEQPHLIAAGSNHPDWDSDETGGAVGVKQLINLPERNGSGVFHVTPHRKAERLAR
jgi:hypothetical protein